MFQIAVYLLAGGLAAYYLTRAHARHLGRHQTTPTTLAGLLFFLCIFSALWSPSFIATVALSGLLGLAMLVTAQFAFYGAQLEADPIVLLHWLRLVAVLLVLLVWVSYAVGIGTTGGWTPEHGFRVRGGRVGVLSMLGPVVALISGYFLVFRLGHPVPQLVWIFFGIAAVWYSKTRGGYVTLLMAGAAIWCFWLWASLKHKRHAFRNVMISALLVAGLTLLLIVQGGFFENVWTRGHPQAITTLTQRTTIWGWIAEKVTEQPFGLGYATGFRHLFISMDPVTRYAYRREGLVVERIGEAHNSHLEFLVGAGWLGFLIYLGLLVVIALRVYRVLRLVPAGTNLAHAGRVVAVMLMMFVVEGMTNSAYALPTRQPFGFFLFAVGLVFMLETRVLEMQKQISKATRQAQINRPPGVPEAGQIDWGTRQAGSAP